MIDITPNESTGILLNNYTGHLGYISQQNPYVIPTTYFYDKENHSIISYSATGHKIDAMRKNPAVSLLVAEIKSTKNWQSVLVHGTFKELQGSEAKLKLHKFTEGVKSVIAKNEHRKTEFISEFSGKLYSRGIPVVYLIKISELTGKRKET